MKIMNRSPYALPPQEETLVAKAPSKKKGKTIRLEALKIEGRIQKPEAFYVLQRAHTKHTGMTQAPKSFIPRILQSLEDLDDLGK